MLCWPLALLWSGLLAAGTGCGVGAVQDVFALSSNPVLRSTDQEGGQWRLSTTAVLWLSGGLTN